MVDQKIVRMWHDKVKYDMDTAKAMFQTGRWIYSIFICQQSIEKCLKALIIYKDKKVVPIHNLRRLAEIASIIQEFDESTLIKLDFLSNDYINAGYKEDLSQLSNGINETVVQNFIQFSEGIIS